MHSIRLLIFVDYQGGQLDAGVGEQPVVVVPDGDADRVDAGAGKCTPALTSMLVRFCPPRVSSAAVGRRQDVPITATGPTDTPSRPANRIHHAPSLYHDRNVSEGDLSTCRTRFSLKSVPY